MTKDQIQTFFRNANLKKKMVKIDFKTRSSINGLFIDTKDADELNAKNFWRIVNESKLEEYELASDSSLGRIFNGAEITKLSQLKVKS